jgi:hypothetical protein
MLGRCIQIALDRQDGWKIPNPYAFDQILDVFSLDEPAGEAKFARVIERIKELIKGRDINVGVDRLPYLADRQPQIWRICESVARRMNELAVKPQEVIPGQTESADRWLACEANMRPVPVVAMEPSGQRGISLL